MAYRGAIFDVDGVLVDSPHELAWREALKELLEGEWRDIRSQTKWTPERFTTAVYQQGMAGKARGGGGGGGAPGFAGAGRGWPGRGVRGGCEGGQGQLHQKRRVL